MPTMGKAVHFTGAGPGWMMPADRTTKIAQSRDLPPELFTGPDGQYKVRESQRLVQNEPPNEIVRIANQRIKIPAY